MKVLPLMSGLGVTEESEIFKVEMPAGGSAYVFSADASGIQGSPTTLDLDVAITAVEMIPSSEPVPTAPPPGSPVVAQPGQTGQVVGPFRFDVSVPFVAGKTVEVRQAAQANGVSLRLERAAPPPLDKTARASHFLHSLRSRDIINAGEIPSCPAR